MIRVTGIAELDRALAAAGAEIEAALANAGRNAAGIVAPAIALQTPYLTGFLQGSERVWATAATEVTFEATAGYASFVHDGTRFMRARPFIDRGLDAAGPAVLDVYERAVDEAVDAE